MMESALAAEGLTVSRGGSRVLDAVDFQVDRGEVFALLGGNGAGKSTTLLTFLGLLTPEAGAARVLGETAREAPERVRANVAYLPEAAALYGHLDARENLRYFLSLAGRRPDDREIDGALDEVALDSAARGRPMDTYSKGMRQKVAISLALLRRVPVLLLDEPTSGLDPLAIDEFNALLRRLSADGVSVLMVTHDVYGACQVAQRIGLLHGGQIVGTFTADGSRVDPEVVHQAFARRGSR